MAIFNSKLFVYQRANPNNPWFFITKKKHYLSVIYISHHIPRFLLVKSACLILKYPLTNQSTRVFSMGYVTLPESINPIFPTKTSIYRWFPHIFPYFPMCSWLKCGSRQGAVAAAPARARRLLVQAENSPVISRRVGVNSLFIPSSKLT